jgi:hypothetical protein
MSVLLNNRAKKRRWQERMRKGFNNRPVSNQIKIKYIQRNLWKKGITAVISLYKKKKFIDNKCSLSFSRVSKRVNQAFGKLHQNHKNE